MLNASTDIRFLKGVGEKRAKLLNQKGIDTVGALLTYFPRSYFNWGNIVKLSDCAQDEVACINGKIVSPVEEINARGGMTLYKFIIDDGSATAQVTLFNQKYLATKLKRGEDYLFYGKVGGNLFLREMSSPTVKADNLKEIEPIYSATDALSSKMIGKLVKTALDLGVYPDEALPEEIRSRCELCDISYAVKNIHFPQSEESLKIAKKRLVFEELFVLQTALYFLKSRKKGFTGCRLKVNYLSDFKEGLGFSLTSAQERVINECLADMSATVPMNRLVQGDVGSGKTAVAAALCYITAKNGYQSAFMAPTEILAEQHYNTLRAITADSGIACGLLTGSMTKKQKNDIKEKIATGEIDVLVGTHALITADVKFWNLGLVITDEQHRFGVAQRGKLAVKGNNPHTLVMSATPIPRTLAMIIYGDLDISIVDEYPKGRQVIDTYFVDSSYRQRIYNYIKKFLDEGRQGYIVCSLVSEKEDADIVSAREYYNNLQNNEFAQYKLGLLHGKMSAKDKEKVMSQFAAGEIQLLIATTVIEVGIDVPNASVMVIENAERFGLSQLHQLRGRIGRGEHKSSCVLISDSKGEETKKRLDVIKNCSDGFKIADEDLNLRGPGDFLGKRQHGLPLMKIADIFADKDVLQIAKQEAELLLKTDPQLRAKENIGLRESVKELYKRLN